MRCSLTRLRLRAGVSSRSALFVLTAALVSALGAQAAQAQEAGLRPGEAFVTRFAGAQIGQPGAALDPNAIVGSIIDLRAPGRPPDGRHWINEPQRAPIRAGETGQIFGVALDDARPPNIYVTATSAFGLHRTADNRTWMPGMWGPGGPGAVYKLEAANGYRPQLFARIAPNGRDNTGAALGNIAYDRAHKQFYVSDLETGLIHRIGLDGSDRGVYDHGGQGRTSFTDAESGQRQSLPAIAFPPQTRAQIEDCQPLPGGTTFSNSPECWNFAPSGRRIWGLGVAQFGPDNVRLFYAVASGPAFGEEGWKQLSEEEKRNSVWSVRIAPDGSFDGADVRREFILPDFFDSEEEIAEKGYSHPVSDIAFPACGTERPVMLASERGGIVNLGLDRATPAFAHPHEARAIRYELDGSGLWSPIGRYDVGFYDRQQDGPPYMRANCAGGAAFGPGYNENNWRVDPSKPDQFVWITGDKLCSPEGPCNGRSPFTTVRERGPRPTPEETGDESHVTGIQGSSETAFDELLPRQATADASAPASPQPRAQPARAPGPQGGDAGAPPPAVAPSQAYLVDVDINVDASGQRDLSELTRDDSTTVGDIVVYQECPAGGARPAYFVPPPVAPRTAWPAWREVHATAFSHARYASHGRRLSHFRFGSHSPDISHNRWRSHWPRLSHNRARSHYRWYSEGHIRPLSPGHNRRLSPTHRRPLSPGHNRRLSPSHRRPLSPVHDRRASPGHIRPLSPGHNRRLSPTHRRPLSPGHARPLSPGHRRPLSPGHTRPLSPGHNRLVSPGHRRALSPRPRRPVQALPGRVGPRRTGPGRVGPARVVPRRGIGPNRIAPRRVVPGRVGPRRVGPDRIGPRRVAPGRVGPGRTGPGRIAPRPVGPRVGPGRAGPGRTGPRRAGPARGEPVRRGGPGPRQRRF